MMMLMMTMTMLMMMMTQHEQGSGEVEAWFNKRYILQLSTLQILALLPFNDAALPFSFSVCPHVFIFIVCNIDFIVLGSRARHWDCIFRAGPHVAVALVGQSTHFDKEAKHERSIARGPIFSQSPLYVEAASGADIPNRAERRKGSATG